jgi:hypothetical protein
MSDKPERGPRLPPRWFIRLAWSVHRGLYRVTRGRVGLRRPRGNRWGTLRLTTMGRRTGRKHSVIIAYLRDRPNLIAMAMNGWADGEPAWWLNLQAHPDASVGLVDGPRLVRARVAIGRRAVASVGQMARDRREAGRLCRPQVVRDCGGDLGGTARARPIIISESPRQRIAVNPHPRSCRCLRTPGLQLRKLNDADVVGANASAPACRPPSRETISIGHTEAGAPGWEAPAIMRSILADARVTEGYG